MVLQSLLCKDYRKTTIATLIRFAVILGNFSIFQELSGWKQEVKLSGKDHNDLIYHYLLNSGALILATLLTLKSLSFGRPDIDSFNETIYLPAQDKNYSFALCAFCLYKYIYQWFKGYGGAEYVATVNVRNLILLASSCISAISSAFFKYEMSNAEKEMVMKINYFLGMISKSAICLILALLTFYQSNGLVSLIFLFVIVIDIFRALKKIYIQNNDKMKIKDYLQLIKWVAFFVAASLALYRPLLLISGKEEGMVRGFFGVRSAVEDKLVVEDLTELMMTVFSLILFSCVLELIDKLEQGASFEIFDIHMIENLEFDPKHEYYKQQQPIEDFDEVSPTSMVVNYFVSKVFLILQISDDSILTRYLNFRQGFINSLANESANIASSLNSFRMTLIKTMNKKTQYFAKVVLFIKLLHRMTVLQLLIHLEVVLKLSINLYSAFNFLFFLRIPEFYSVLRYSLLIWNVLSMVSKSQKVMTMATIVLIYPFYFIDFVQISIKRFLRELGRSPGQPETPPIDPPLTSDVYFALILLVSLYLAFLILTADRPNKENRWKLFLASKRRLVHEEESLTEKMVGKLVSIIEEKLYRIYRYIPLVLALLTALHSISIFNMVLFSITLLFLWKPELDLKYWTYYNTYIIFVMVLKLICNYSLTLNQYNVELVGLVGFITIEEDQSKENSRLSYLMITNFCLVYFSCGWYKWLHSKKTEQTNKRMSMAAVTDSAISGNILDSSIVKFFISSYKFFSLLTQYYSIWIFHLCCSLILLADERDLLNMVLLMTEMLILFIHVLIWNRKGDHPYTKIYKVWIGFFYLTVVYAMYRYLLFFSKFSIVKGMFDQVTNATLRDYFFLSISHLKHGNVHQVQTYLRAYFWPLILLSLVVFTRESFKRYFIRSEAGQSKVTVSVVRTMLLTDLMNKEVVDLTFQRDIKSIRRQINPFVVGYLIFKGLFLSLIMKFFSVNMNIMKLLMIFCYLLNMKALFEQLIDLCQQMKLIQHLTLRSKYFYITFLTGKKWKDDVLDDDLKYFYDSEVQKLDLGQNKEYYNQFLLRMEKILFTVNRLFWGLKFFPLMFLSGLLLITNFFVTDSKVVNTYQLDLFMGIKTTDWSNRELINNELTAIQIVLVGLVFEYLFTTYYMDCSSLLTELDDSQLEKLLNNIQIKYTYLIDHRLGRFDKAKNAEKLEEFKSCLAKPEIKKTDVQSEESEKKDPDNSLEEESEEEEKSEGEEVEEEDDSDDSDNIKGQPKNTPAANDEEEQRFMSLKKHTAEKQTTTIFYMSELSSKEEMLLFLHKNKYKYYLMKFLEGGFYSLSRLSLLPLFFSLINHLSVFTVPFYIVFFLQSLKTKKLFFDEIREKNKAMMILLAIQTLHLFIHERLYRDNNPYKTFLDQKIGAKLRHLLFPAESTDFISTFYWLFLNSFAFAMVPISVWMSVKFLFREKLKKKEIFHFYLFDQQRKRNIIIDFKRWKNSAISFLNIIYKTIYLNSIETHSLMTIILVVLFYKQLYTLVFLYTLGISIYEHFKTDNRESGKVVKNEYMKRLMRIYVYIFFTTVLQYHLIVLLAKMNFFDSYNGNEINFLKEYNAGFLTIFLMAITLVFEDLVDTQDYFSIMHQMKLESNLKIKYANLCAAYDINEKKIYNRVIRMMSKSHTDTVSAQFLERKDVENIQIDHNYSEKCVLRLLERSSRRLTDEYMSFFRRNWLSLLNNFYRFLNDSSNHYRNQDILFLYNNMRLRNSKVLEEYDVNIEEYFEQDLGVISKAFQKASLFYMMLCEGEPYNMKMFEKSSREFIAKEYSNTEDIDNFKANKVNTILKGAQAPNEKSRRPNVKKKITKDKTKEELLLGMNVLHRVLTTTYDLESKSLVDNYKLEFKKRGSLNCMFGKMKVILYNIQDDDISKTVGFNIVRFRIILSYITRALVSNSEYVISFALIAIHVTYGGLFNTVIIGIIIFTIFVEETSGRAFWWKILYIIYLALIIFKRTSGLLGLSNGSLYMNFLFSDIQHDVLCIILVMYMIEFLKKYGVDNKAAVDMENPAVALARLTINQDFEDMIDRICQDEIKKNESLNLYLSSNMSMNVTNISLKDFKMICIKQVIRNYSELKKFKNNFLHYTQNLMKVMKYDLLKYGGNQLDNFFFRNFSSYLRKSGRDYFGIISVIFLLMIFYVLVFFPTLSSNKTQIASFLFANSVSFFTVFNFAIYLTFFLIHYYIDQMKSHDVTGLFSREYSLSLMNNFDRTIVKNASSSVLDKFRSAAFKVKNVMILCLNFRKEQNISTTYRSNPLLYMYIASMSVWIYLNISVFFWHSTHGNASSSTKTGLDKFICFEQDKRRARDAGLQPCTSFRDNINSQIFYWLNILYLFFSMMQIKYGKIHHQSKIKDLTGTFEQLLYKIYGAVPLIREARCTFEYCATKTSLFFSDFILLKELEFLMYDAKIEMNANMGKQTGKTLSRPSQYSLCIIMTGILVGLMMGPLFLFFNQNNNTAYAIKGASISIDLMVNGNQHFGNLFQSNRLKDSISWDQYTQEQKDASPFSKAGLNKYSASRYNILKFSKYSEKFLTFTPKMMQDIRSFIQDPSNDVSVRISIVIDTEAKIDPRSTSTSTVAITDGNRNQFLALFSSGCESNSRMKGQTASTEVFLRVISSIILLEKKEAKFIDAGKFQIKLALSMKCSEQNRNYIWIAEESDDITFLVIGKSKLDLGYLSRLESEYINLQKIYILIFAVIGFNVLRSTFFGQTPKIWNLKLPYPEKILILLDAIELARLQDDLIKEELLYFVVIDIMRNPELLRSLTESVFVRRQDLFIKGLDENKQLVDQQIKMLRKCSKEVEVSISIADSKRKFRLRVDIDIRLKSIANKLSGLMGLDPYRTEWAFFYEGDEIHEIPITYTLNQCSFHGDRHFLIGKIMTTTMKENYFEEFDSGTRFFAHVYGKSKIHSKSIGVQTDKDNGKVRQPRFTVDGIVREQRAKENPLPKRDYNNIWENLMRIEQSRILRGMNVVGYCKNEKCVNFQRWICISLGLGRFSNKRIEEVAKCELCPRKDMFKLKYQIVGMFFKECVWKVERSRTALAMPNPLPLEQWRGKATLAVTIDNFYVFDTIFSGTNKDVEVNVLPLHRGDQQSIFYKNPNVSYANRIY